MDKSATHHLHKGDEEDDGAEGSKEKPSRVRWVITAKEGGGEATLVEEVGRGIGDPLEKAEAGATLEDKEGDALLKDEADDDGVPLDHLSVTRAEPVNDVKAKQAAGSGETRGQRGKARRPSGASEDSAHPKIEIVRSP